MLTANNNDDNNIVENKNNTNENQQTATCKSLSALKYFSVLDKFCCALNDERNKNNKYHVINTVINYA